MYVVSVVPVVFVKSVVSLVYVFLSVVGGVSVFSVVSVTTAHVQCIKNKKGHFSADAELEDLGETSYRAPKKKGPQIVKF